MESVIEKKSNQYDEAWFKDRALNSVKRIEEGSWDFSDSLLLYLPKGGEEYKSMQKEGTPYFELVTKPEQEYLDSIATVIAAKLPNDFEYVDLGPGTEHKEQYLFDALRIASKKFEYTPVDINEYFLALAEKHARDQNIPTHSVQASFEEFAARVGESKKTRLVSLGLTFSNYRPADLFPLLTNIAGEKGIIFIDAHMRDRTDMHALREVYDMDARGIVLTKLELLDMKSEDITGVQTTEGVEVWCQVINPSAQLVTKGVKPGDKMLIFQSLRYTKDSFEEEIKKSFKKYKLFDTGSPFVGALVWNE